MDITQLRWNERLHRHLVTQLSGEAQLDRLKRANKINEGEQAESEFAAEVIAFVEHAHAIKVAPMMAMEDPYEMEYRLIDWILLSESLSNQNLRGWLADRLGDILKVATFTRTLRDNFAGLKPNGSVQ